MGFGRYRFRRSFGNVSSQFRGARPDTYPLFSGLLDQYSGAAAAYSLRALSSGWLAGDVVEVRRSSDSTSQDFTASQITSGAMLAWVTEFSGTADGFVSTWYDQSGNANNATQIATTSQPKIVDAGALIEDANGNAWIDFQNAAGGSIGLDLDSNIRETNGASSIFASIKFDEIFTGSAEFQSPLFLYDTQRWLVSSTTNTFYQDISISDAGGVTADQRYVRFPATLTNHNLLSSIYDGSSTTGGGKPDIQFDENAVAQVGTDGSIDFGVPTTGTNSIGYRMDTSNQGCNAKFQELIIYASDQSANRVAIETNINDHYGIYA